MGQRSGGRSDASRAESNRTAASRTVASRAMALVLLLCLLGLAGCGGSGRGAGSHASRPPGGAASPSTGAPSAREKLYGKRRGGTLIAYSSVDVTHLDPGQADSPLDDAIAYATGRPLFSYAPSSLRRLEPNLAVAVPTSANHGITDGGRTVTVHIRPDVRFSPPVDRPVSSADVAYAIERGANPHVANPYFSAYFGELVGAASASGGPIPGIRTPNRTTIVFRLSRPAAGLLINALSLPLSAPVPESFARPMDRHAPTTYGTLAEVATGPYMLRSRRRTGVFAGLGYVRGRSLTLVRNPNWSRSTYSSAFHPPAYLNRIEVAIGAAATSIGTQVLSGSDSLELDAPAASVVQTAESADPSQVAFTVGSGTTFGELNTRTAPFDNVWLRRAVWAALDRDAIAKASGGPLLAQPLTQYLTPGVAGFARAGGYAGPSDPWNRYPGGDLTLAHSLMKRGGYPSGDYTGSATIDEVGDDEGDGPAIAGIVQSALTSLGFKVVLTGVDASVQASRYCGVPAAEIAVCPAGGAVRAFGDAASLLVPSVLQPSSDPGIVRAEDTSQPRSAAAVWARVDRRLVEDAVGLPETLDTGAAIRSADVAGVVDAWNSGTWDLTFTSLDNP